MTKEVMWSQLEVGSLQAGIDLENRTQVLSSMTGDMREAHGRVPREAAPDYGSDRAATDGTPEQPSAMPARSLAWLRWVT